MSKQIVSPAENPMLAFSSSHLGKKEREREREREREERKSSLDKNIKSSSEKIFLSRLVSKSTKVQPSNEITSAAPGSVARGLRLGL